MKIKVIDKMNAEDGAMLQALYSRSKDSVDNHLKDVKAKGSGKFMDQYYIGYGHKSIGDCGSFTIYFEGISDIAVKAFQNHQLYNGQQSSTRYINFLETPEKEMKDKDIKKHFYCDAKTKPKHYRPHIAHYQRIIEVMTSSLYMKKLLESKNEDISLLNNTAFIKAYNPKVYDVARNVLPVGVLTNFSWHTNLRQAKDLLEWLEYHELKEVRDIVAKLKKELQAKFKHSFNWDHSRREANYKQSMMDDFYFSTLANHDNRGMFQITIDYAMGTSVNKYGETVYHAGNYFLDMKKMNNARPYGSEIFPFVIDPLNITVLGSLDIGAFRDLQRHRSLKFNFPKIKLNNLINDIRNTIIVSASKHDILFEPQVEQLLNVSYANYYNNEIYTVPFATKVPVLFQANLKSITYLLEIRSKSTVHPTLRIFIDQLYTELLKNDIFAKFAHNIFIDTSENKLVDTHRGTQDIIKK